MVDGGYAIKPNQTKTDSGLPFTFSTFQDFLQTWCVMYRLPSIAYRQSNGGAELIVKTAKRIVNGNIGLQGYLNNDNVA